MKILSAFCIALLKFYQWVVSPIFSSLGITCRFTPSCSEYSIQAVKIHGAWKGILMGASRLCRCQPLCRGGHDPVTDTFVLWRRVQ